MGNIIGDLALRLNPALLLRRVGIEPYPWQVKAANDPSQQILFLTSRQAGKSTLCAALAVHTALYRDRATVLLVAPTLRQSQELARKAKAFASALNLPLVGDSALRVELKGGGRILALPGAEDTIRGYSADLVIIDEAAWVSNELYTAIRPMLAVTRGRLVAISTPYGSRGWFWRTWHSSEEGWARYRVPAHEIPTISAEFLEAEKRALGDMIFRQEYMAEFVGSGGALPEEQVYRAVRLPGPEEPRPDRVYVAGLDLARVMDWTSLSVLDVTEEPYRLVFQERWKTNWEHTVQHAVELFKKYRARVTIDATGLGDPIFERIRTEWPAAHPFKFTTQTKAALINELRLNLAEEHVVLYPDSVLIAELIALEAKQTAYGISYEAPAGGHDDTVISLALALWTIRGRVPEYSSVRVRSRWG